MVAPRTILRRTAITLGILLALAYCCLDYLCICFYFDGVSQTNYLSLGLVEGLRQRESHGWSAASEPAQCSDHSKYGNSRHKLSFYNCISGGMLDVFESIPYCGPAHLVLPFYTCAAFQFGKEMLNHPDLMAHIKAAGQQPQHYVDLLCANPEAYNRVAGIAFYNDPRFSTYADRYMRYTPDSHKKQRRDQTYRRAIDRFVFIFVDQDTGEIVAIDTF